MSTKQGDSCLLRSSFPSRRWGQWPSSSTPPGLWPAVGMSCRVNVRLMLAGRLLPSTAWPGSGLGWSAASFNSLARIGSGLVGCFLQQPGPDRVWAGRLLPSTAWPGSGLGWSAASFNSLARIGYGLGGCFLQQPGPDRVWAGRLLPSTAWLGSGLGWSAASFNSLARIGSGLVGCFLQQPGPDRVWAGRLLPSTAWPGSGLGRSPCPLDATEYFVVRVFNAHNLLLATGNVSIVLRFVLIYQCAYMYRYHRLASPLLCN